MRLTYGTKIAFTTEAVREHYCFYVHEILSSFTETTDDKAGEIFFAGVCKLRDVLMCPDAYMNSCWRETVNDSTIIRATIMSSSEREADMFNELSGFVKTYRPHANVRGFQTTVRAAITCTVGPNAGKSWQTQERAALENGISQPSLSNHLNGKRGYENIRGMKFKRGIA
jgi:hypothetical protein